MNNNKWWVINPAENGWSVTEHERDERGRQSSQRFIFHDWGAVVLCLYNLTQPDNWIVKDQILYEVAPATVGEEHIAHVETT